jgi:hypothetical protein
MTIALLLVPFMAWAAEPVGLGVANSFAVLAGTTITNTGATTINGDVGLHPGTATPGLTPEMVNGEFHVANAEALDAKNALAAAYIEVAGRTPDDTIGAGLGGTTVFGGGVYASGSGAFTINGPVTLDAMGDPDAIFIFQMATTLTTGVGSSVVLTNGAQACNVYWQVGSSADLFANTTFRGTILALTSINLQNGASISGRALARNGAVTMDTNTITQVGCAAPVEATTTTTTAATTTTTAAATTTTTAAAATTTTAAAATTTTAAAATTTTAAAATTTTVAAATTTTVADTTSGTAVAGSTTTVAAAGTTSTTVLAGSTTTVAAAGTTATTSGIDALVTPTTMAFPDGGAQTGGSSTSGPDMALVAVGAVLLASAAGAFGWRMLSVRRNS